MASRRRKQEEEHENHERWLVSYADFITLLFAFFVVMYAISSLNEGKYRVMSSAIMDAFRNGTVITVQSTPPTGGANTMIEIPQTKPIAKAVSHGRKEAEAAKLGQLTQNLAKVLSPLVQSGEVTITQTDQGINIDIRDSALFAIGQAEPNQQSLPLMSNMAKLLSGVDNAIKVEGFTDDAPIRTPAFPSNWELSAARAGGVVRLFQENGIAAQRMVAVGHGANLPVADNATSEGRARNRRVTVSVQANTFAEPDSPESSAPAADSAKQQHPTPTEVRP
ncbi:flagellar motor protein MotD [Chromobacterium piscinae]|uniref:Flagellar motor protein MotD n=3 Tax=Chromobacterium piscinae TaxID=686831 RepID=A0ABV0H6S8_9NEIS|nr:flagellar motor protein MotD [Chromobacterium piscinae]MBX9297747.1 flagellar motor protein MotD [Chromobacterium vaccinii]MBX9357407.1 flagellar motor protein MotD [Chromobacterium vaccinii]MCD4506683.1 flagellar motor protein MotD [Chromobacterium piscinae]